MAVLIDGNNLHHAVWSTDEQWCDLTRTGLCEHVAAFVGAGQATVVFDGARPQNSALRDELGLGVTLMYSGPRVEADAVIERLITADSSPRRLIVVSSDRRLRQAALRRRARSVRSEAFAHAMFVHWVRPPVNRPSDPPEKRLGLEDPADIEVWMAALGLSDDSGSAEEFELPWR